MNDQRNVKIRDDTSVTTMCLGISKTVKTGLDATETLMKILKFFEFIALSSTSIVKCSIRR